MTARGAARGGCPKNAGAQGARARRPGDGQDVHHQALRAQLLQQPPPDDRGRRLRPQAAHRRAPRRRREGASARRDGARPQGHDGAAAALGHRGPGPLRRHRARAAPRRRARSRRSRNTEVAGLLQGRVRRVPRLRHQPTGDVQDHRRARRDSRRARATAFLRLERTDRPKTARTPEAAPARARRRRRRGASRLRRRRRPRAARRRRASAAGATTRRRASAAASTRGRRAAARTPTRTTTTEYSKRCAGSHAMAQLQGWFTGWGRDGSSPARASSLRFSLAASRSFWARWSLSSRPLMFAS